MMDDWLTRGDTREEAKGNLIGIKSIIGSVGHTFADDKEDIAQCIIYLGVKFDTVRMRMSFDAVQAKAFRIHLEECLASLDKGLQLNSTMVRSVAGKWGWYSEVLQSGRLHLRSWWNYFRFGKNLKPYLRHRLLKDTRWWISILAIWELGELNEIEYPIISANELLCNNKAVYVIQSDASGIHGYGYFEGYLQEDNPTFVARRWENENNVKPHDEDWYNPMRFTTSHDSELKVLDYFLTTTILRNVMLIWVTDCLAAVWTVNKGRCYEELGLITLASILEKCDDHKIVLVALWVPRESNEYADYLSHLCHYVNRDEVRTSFALLERILTSISNKKGNVAAAKKARCYEEWCDKLNIKAYPVTYLAIASFICNHVIKNKGSTRSVANVQSQVKRSCERINKQWLSREEGIELKETIRCLRIEDMSNSRRKRPLLRHHIQQIISKMDMKKDIELYVALLLETGHNGLLRVGELLSGIKVVDVAWNAGKSSFKLFIKSTKVGTSATIGYDDFGGVNAVTLMRLWFDRMMLWDKPEVHVFPSLTNSGRSFRFNQTASTNWFRKKIKKACDSIGLDSKEYSGHSLRAGGATDLFIARVPYYVIKKKGRWRSDAAMIYYRDDEDVERAVNTAFQQWNL